MNVFIDIDIFKSDLIDIDIFITCRYIDNRYGLSLYRTPLVNTDNTVNTVDKVDTVNTVNMGNTVNTIKTSEPSASSGRLLSILFYGSGYRKM